MSHQFGDLNSEIENALGAALGGVGQSLRRKPGAQPGNQNARRRGVYDRALTHEQRNLLRAVRRNGSLTGEVALLRVKVAGILLDPRSDPDLVLRATRMLLGLLNRDRRRLLARDG